MQGVVLPSGKTWEIVEPIIQHVRTHRWNSQESSLMSLVVCIVLFTDDPRASIQRVRQLIQEKLLSMEGTRVLTKTLGYSRCPDAVALLRELADDNVRVQHLGDDWVDAVARFDSQEARDLLMSFIDPALPPLSKELIRHHDGRLVRRLAELAQRDATVQRRMFDLTKENIPAEHATVLGKVLASLGTADALLASLELLRDDGTGGASYELHKNIAVLPIHSLWCRAVPTQSEAGSWRWHKTTHYAESRHSHCSTKSKNGACGMEGRMVSPAALRWRLVSSGHPSSKVASE
jgi:hypothetical protein